MAKKFKKDSGFTSTGAFKTSDAFKTTGKLFDLRSVTGQTGRVSQGNVSPVTQSEIARQSAIEESKLGKVDEAKRISEENKAFNADLARRRTAGAGRNFLPEPKATSVDLLLRDIAGSGEGLARQIDPFQNELEIARILAQGGRKARTPQDVAAGQVISEEAGGLSSELGNKIFNQPSLSPSGFVGDGLFNASNEFQLGIIASTGNVFLSALEKITGKTYGRSTGKELAQTTFGKVLGTGLLTAEGAIGAIYAAPLLARTFATKAATLSILSKSGALKTALAGLGTFFIGKQVLDYKGGELDTMRAIVGSYTEDGERIQSLVLQGMSPEDALGLLQTMSNEIDQAESRIQDIGNDNIIFRYDKEWKEDMQTIRSARLAIRRRVVAVQNIAATGRGNLDPLALIYTASEFDDFNAGFE